MVNLFPNVLRIPLKNRNLNEFYKHVNLLFINQIIGLFESSENSIKTIST